MTSPAPESTTLLVIAKQPVPGRVKTRLVPPCTHEQAAALAEAALADTLHTTITGFPSPDLFERFGLPPHVTDTATAGMVL
jgi:hypothetical protein